MFYFAWVDETDITWTSAFQRTDEHVLSFTIDHREGEFPQADIAIKNPRVGFLSPGRKRWAWLTDGDTPLFFGRLVAIPDAMQAEVVSLKFVARPLGYDQTKRDLADSLKVLPYYDPIFIPAASREDPDTVLEGYSAIWHISRTGAVTISDLILGEDGTVTIAADQHLYNGLSTKIACAPTRRIDFTVTATWTQVGSGEIDVTAYILDAFRNVQTINAQNVTGSTLKAIGGSIGLLGAKGFISSWPSPGTNIGAGWIVGSSSLTLLTRSGSSIIYGGTDDPLTSEQLEALFPGDGVRQNMQAQTLHPWGWSGISQDVYVTWIPAVRASPYMTCKWTVSRARKETVTFSLSADSQDLYTDETEPNTIYASATGAVDENIGGTLAIGDVLRRQYFSTDRGKQSIEHCLLRARAALLASARAIEITAAVPYEYGRDLDLSCRLNAVIADPRLPGGLAAGKVIAYQLAATGAGRRTCTITIGSVPGTGGTVAAAAGDPQYVDAGYVAGYQTFFNKYVVPGTSDIRYLDSDLNYACAAGDLDFQSPRISDLLQSVVVTGGWDAQVSALTATTKTSLLEVQEPLAKIRTTCTITLTPIGSQEYHTQVALTVGTLQLPQLINLAG